MEKLRINNQNIEGFQCGITPNFSSELGVFRKKTLKFPVFCENSLDVRKPAKSGILQFVFRGCVSQQGFRIRMCGTLADFFPK
jgi:hypothetical protein